ncbi:MAG: YggS family pyridoxal phosphate-dependent enzyme [Gammaproteobacteria bacterium]|nr:YggS family pyridoxal phosphate-dependent enzyme [Gammaproteobacteria bacterium]
MTQITDHLHEVRDRVKKAASAAGRAADEITIVAVSKKHPVTAVEAAYCAGQRDFGENFVQEAVPKIESLGQSDIRWHFIGSIQANKTRDIARFFDWVHTVDRLKIAKRLNDQRPHYAAPLNICIQVNLAEEPQKSGVAADEVGALVEAVCDLSRLRLRGLMTMPPADADADTIEALFLELARMQSSLVTRGFELDTLSMGMSADLETAVSCGSTMVRIGTAIFGPRG